MAGTIEINNFPYNLLTDDYRSDGTAPPDSPPESGGTAAMSYYAPNGFNTARKIVISSSTLTFTEPEYVNFLGFGLGWMYLNPIGTPFHSHTNNTLHGVKTVGYEGDAQGDMRNRRIYSDGTTRFLRMETNTASPWASVGGGMINMDMGRNLTQSDFVYSFNVGKCVIGSGRVAGYPQLKDHRIGQYANLPPDEANANSLYVKAQGDGAAVDLYFIETEGGLVVGHDKYFPLGGINREGNLYGHGLLWKQNTPDVADGYHVGQAWEDGVTSYYTVVPFAPTYGYTYDHIRTTSPNRPRWSKWQGTVQNVTTEQDIYWDTTDFYTQLNGTIFVLANNSAITSATRFVPMIITDFISGESVELNLYAGHVGGFEGNTIFALDSQLNVIGSVTL